MLVTIALTTFIKESTLVINIKYWILVFPIYVIKKRPGKRYNDHEPDKQKSVLYHSYIFHINYEQSLSFNLNLIFKLNSLLSFRWKCFILTKSNRSRAATLWFVLINPNNFAGSIVLRSIGLVRRQVASRVNGDLLKRFSLSLPWLDLRLKWFILWGKFVCTECFVYVIYLSQGFSIFFNICVEGNWCLFQCNIVAVGDILFEFQWTVACVCSQYFIVQPGTISFHHRPINVDVHYYNDIVLCNSFNTNK